VNGDLAAAVCNVWSAAFQTKVRAFCIGYSLLPLERQCLLACLVSGFSGVNAHLLYVALFAVSCERGPAN